MNLDELLAPIPKKVGKPCKVAVVIDSLEGKYKEAVINLVKTSYREGGLTDDALSARLVSAGLPVSSTTIRKHRAGSCPCGKATA